MARRSAFKGSSHLALFAIVLPLVRAWLYSSGGEIRSESTHLPVRLRCVNWYGAHMRSFVAGGLDKRSCGAIAQSIVEIGANCVRIPLSVELVLEDLSPPASAIAGLNITECNASTALEVLDCQVQELTRRGLMVILNNHNTVAGWIGYDEQVPQGLWHTSMYPTSAWVASLSMLARRYRSNRLVVGIDIRNEIHDQDGTVITWGKSNDTDSDWKAATMLADAAIREANPDVLVIVSGLSLSYDLRAMQDLVNYRAKYVFTTHTYTTSWWFTYVNWVVVMWLSLLFVAADLGVVLWLHRKQHTPRFHTTVRYHGHSWTYVVAGAVLLPVYTVAVSLAWITEANRNGCHSIAEDAVPTLWVGIVGLFVVVVACCVLVRYENVMRWSWLLQCFCLWNACLGVVQAAFSCFYQTYWAVQWELRRWESRDIPVWVGEFGNVVGDTSVAWGWLLRYIGDMHYAYWPLNGCATRFDTLRNDTYGILDCDWATVRNVNWTRSVFPQE